MLRRKSTKNQKPTSETKEADKQRAILLKAYQEFYRLFYELEVAYHIVKTREIPIKNWLAKQVLLENQYITLTSEKIEIESQPLQSRDTIKLIEIESKLKKLTEHFSWTQKGITPPELQSSESDYWHYMSAIFNFRSIVIKFANVENFIRDNMPDRNDNVKENILEALLKQDDSNILYYKKNRVFLDNIRTQSLYPFAIDKAAQALDEQQEKINNEKQQIEQTKKDLLNFSKSLKHFKDYNEITENISSMTTVKGLKEYKNNYLENYDKESKDLLNFLKYTSDYKNTVKKWNNGKLSLEELNKIHAAKTKKQQEYWAMLPPFVADILREGKSVFPPTDPYFKHHKFFFSNTSQEINRLVNFLNNCDFKKIDQNKNLRKIKTYLKNINIDASHEVVTKIYVTSIQKVKGKLHTANKINSSRKF